MLERGQKAPAFTLPDQNGDLVMLSDLKGQTVVLYFIPAPTRESTASACRSTQPVPTSRTTAFSRRLQLCPC